MKRVLALAGGGIRGIAQMSALDSALENCEHGVVGLTSKVDLVAGTSIGALTGTALLLGMDPWGIVQRMRDIGPDVFRRHQWQAVKSLGGLVDENYSSEPLHQAITEIVGRRRLGDLPKKFMVTSYDLRLRQPQVYKSWRQEDRQDDIVNVLMATSAAPTYFEPFGSQIDGGVWGNNPAMAALAEAERLWPGEEKKLLLLGTGRVVRSIDPEEASGWGLVGWAPRMVNLLFDAQHDAISYYCRQMLGSGFLEINGPLRIANDDMDDASQANMNALVTEGKSWLRGSHMEQPTTKIREWVEDFFYGDPDEGEGQ